MRSGVLSRALAVVAAVVVAGVAFTPGVASAHVSVSSANATQGGYAKVTFRVPNEKADAGTVKLEVVLPADKPIVSASTKPIAGWTAVVEKAKLPTPVKTDDGELTEAVSKITWTASPDAMIQAGQFQEFDVSLGPLPEADQIVFKALQTYSDNEIVRWIEEPSGSTEPEYPAPVLKLAKADQAQDAHGGSGATAETTGSGGSVAGDGADDDGSNGLILTIAVAGLILGLAGLILGLLAYRKAVTRVGA